MRVDYTAESEVLARLLQPGQPGTGIICGWDQPTTNEMAYLGDYDVWMYESRYVQDFSDDPEWQEHLRHAWLIAEGRHRNWPTLQWQAPMHSWTGIACRWYWRVCAEVPFSALAPIDQAFYRLRSLMVNNYSWVGDGRGDGHHWALVVGNNLFNRYWDHPQARQFDWEDADAQDDEESAPLAHLIKLLIDERQLVDTCQECEIVEEAELPPTPPFAWVQAANLLQRLFPQINCDQEAADEVEKLEMALAFALQGLRDERPESWDTLVYLNDAFCQCRNTTKRTIVERLEAVPRLQPYAQKIAALKEVDDVNVVLRDLYKTAPTLGVWIVG